MLRQSCILPALLFSLAASPVAQTPSPAKTVPPKADYAQEAFVIEQFSHKEKFDNDGIFSWSETSRVRL